MQILDYKFLQKDEHTALYNVKTGGIFRVYDENLRAQLEATVLTGEISPELEITLTKHKVDSNENITKNNCINAKDFIINRLTLVLTNKCNLRCKYCYANYGQYTYEKDEQKDMSIADIDEITQYFLDNFKGIRHIMFFGGEPTLQSDKIIYTINKFKELKATNQIAHIPRLGLITNGVYFPVELAQALADINEGITLSVDGDMAIQDKLRPTVTNKGSFNSIKKTYNLLLENNVRRIEIESTYTNQHLIDNVSLVQLVKFFKNEFNCKVPHIVLVNIEDENELSTIHNKDKLFLYLEELVEYTFVNLLENNELNTIGILAGMINKLVKNRSNHKICPAGLNTISIGSDKKIQPCFMYTSDDEISAGSLELEGDQVLDNLSKFDDKINNKNNLLECQNCFIKRVCSSCLGHFNIKGENIQAKSELNCEFSRKMAELVLLKIVEIKEDVNKWNTLLKNLK